MTEEDGWTRSDGKSSHAFVLGLCYLFPWLYCLLSCRIMFTVSNISQKMVF